MKKKALLYTRISTDDKRQPNSLGIQKDKLVKWCRDNNVEILNFYIDQSSAKEGFDRPEYQELQSFISSNKGKVDYLLVVQWSRFSRKLSHALTEIERLEKFNVEVNAIEEWADKSTPESYMLQVVRMVQPEIENKRLSIRTREGMRRARLDGKSIGAKLWGYTRFVDSFGKPFLVPDPIKAPLILEAYTLYSSGLYQIEEVRKLLYKKGLKVSKNHLPNILKNERYAGWDNIPDFQGQPGGRVKCQHEPIISEDLFRKVELIFAGKKPRNPVSGGNSQFPLRGFLICPRCSKTLTGSISKGRNGIPYPAYHCQKLSSEEYRCKERIPVKVAESQFMEFLKSITLKPEVKDLYLEMLSAYLKRKDNIGKSELENLVQKKTEIDGRLYRAYNSMLDGKTDNEEYLRFKHHAKLELQNLESRIWDLNAMEIHNEKHLKVGLTLLSNLDMIYEKGNYEVKRKMVGSIFKEKLIFENGAYRTASENALLSLLLSSGEASKETKKKKADSFLNQPTQAPPLVLEPSQKILCRVNAYAKKILTGEKRGEIFTGRLLSQ